MFEALKSQSRILQVIWVLLFIATAVSFGLGLWERAFVSLLALLLSFAPALLASRFAIEVPVPFMVATTLFIVASIVAGELFDFYERLWWWDIALHGASALGFGLIGFLFIFMLFEGDRYAAPPAALALLAFCVAMTVGAVWEIFEFAMDTLFGFNMQKSGLDDTMGDLIVNAVGAALGALSGFLYQRGGEGQFLVPLIREFVERNRRLYQRAKERIGR